MSLVGFTGPLWNDEPRIAVVWFHFEATLEPVMHLKDDLHLYIFSQLVWNPWDDQLENLIPAISLMKNGIFAHPILTLMKEDAPQRNYPLRDLFNGLRWFVRAGCPWRMMPNDLPPWHTIHQQTMRWIKAGCFESHGA